MRCASYGQWQSLAKIRREKRGGKNQLKGDGKTGMQLLESDDLDLGGEHLINAFLS